MKIKVIFDKEALSNRYSKGWGISYLIDEQILFDVGEKVEYICNNFEMLKVDIKKIRKVVISHNRWNHRAGLWELLKANNEIKVFSGSDFLKEFKEQIRGYTYKLVTGPEEIAKDVYTTGFLLTRDKENNIEEQALILRTARGISLILACSHPGILKFIERAKEMFPKETIYAVLGGFGLIDQEERFIKYVVSQIKKIGVENIGPSHCTGFLATEAFRKVYKENFLDIKIGKEIEV